MRTGFHFHRASGTRRGSTILLVITILSLLALLAVGLAFTSRMEQSTAANFGDGVQNRTAALTGVTAVSAKLVEELPRGAIGPLDLSLDSEFLGLRRGTQTPDAELAAGFRQRAAAGGANLAPYETSGTAEVGLIDASSRININAATEEVLARFFTLAGREIGVGLNGDRIGSAIAEIRLGSDGAPGVAGEDDDRDVGESPLKQTNRSGRGTRQGTSADDSVRKAAESRLARADSADSTRREAELIAIFTNVDEDDEYVADVRLPAFGDDVRFGSLTDLLQYDSIRSAGLTREVLEILEPLLTTFSTSVEERVDSEGLAKPLLDVNRASAEDLAAELISFYGSEKEADLLRQFALNLVDARDTDNVPTTMEGSDGAMLMGVEKTPYILEVYPDAITPEEGGDDGQFLEIHNPWPEEYDVTGWRVSGPGVSVRLSGRIAPQGFLVITDDADNTLDPTSDEDLPGTGSLYDIFGVLADGYHERVMEISSLEMPNQGRFELRLEDADGNLVDVFEVLVTQDQLDELYSWQRDNPMVRHAWKRRATPFGLARRALEPDPETLALIQAYPPNAPFTSAAEALNVFAGYAGDGDSGSVVNWGFPVAATPLSADPQLADLARHEAVIDGRILDVLTVDWVEHEDWDTEETESGGEDARLPMVKTRRAAVGGGGQDPAADAVLAANSWFEPVPGTHHGRVNLNTASAVVLASLPGVSEDAALEIADRRTEELANVATGQGGDGLLYRRPSDVLVDDELLGQPRSRAERIDRFGALWAHAALNSRAFVLVGQPRADSASAGGIQKAMRVTALAALDRGMPEIVAFDSGSE